MMGSRSTDGDELRGGWCELRGGVRRSVGGGRVRTAVRSQDRREVKRFTFGRKIVGGRTRAGNGGGGDPKGRRSRILWPRHMSYSPSQPSPAPPLSRASIVIGLYGAMALVSLVIAAGRGDPDLYRFASGTHWALLAGPVVGVAVGLAFVGMTRVATRHFAWARYLHVSFHDLLGPLTRREGVILALGSSNG